MTSFAWVLSCLFCLVHYFNPRKLFCICYYRNLLICVLFSSSVLPIIWMWKLELITQLSRIFLSCFMSLYLRFYFLGGIPQFIFQPFCYFIYLFFVYPVFNFHEFFIVICVFYYFLWSQYFLLAL